MRFAWKSFVSFSLVVASNGLLPSKGIMWQIYGWIVRENATQFVFGWRWGLGFLFDNLCIGYNNRWRNNNLHFFLLSSNSIRLSIEWLHQEQFSIHATRTIWYKINVCVCVCVSTACKFTNDVPTRLQCEF